MIPVILTRVRSRLNRMNFRTKANEIPQRISDQATASLLPCPITKPASSGKRPARALFVCCGAGSVFSQYLSRSEPPLPLPPRAEAAAATDAGSTEHAGPGGRLPRHVAERRGVLLETSRANRNAMTNSNNKRCIIYALLA